LLGESGETLAVGERGDENRIKCTDKHRESGGKPKENQRDKPRRRPTAEGGGQEVDTQGTDHFNVDDGAVSAD
jgi:hypothetical protein